MEKIQTHISSQYFHQVTLCRNVELSFSFKRNLFFFISKSTAQDYRSGSQKECDLIRRNNNNHYNRYSFNRISTFLLNCSLI